jgi:anti-sigma regulatory factor (Ser/Thr protein kinase)
MVDEVRLVAGELATNAVVHTHSPFTVILEGRENSVLLTVTDGSQNTPDSCHPARHGVGMPGLGLVIVALMSQTWGVRVGATESVWACFETRSPTGL